MSNFAIRRARPDDRAAAYYVCLKTGDHGRDGEPFYRDDPDALGRIFVGPYLEFEPELSLVVEDEQGVCGYCLAALDSRAFYAVYDRQWRPHLCDQFPLPTGDPAGWTRAGPRTAGIISPITSAPSRTNSIRRTCTSICSSAPAAKASAGK